MGLGPGEALALHHYGKIPHSFKVVLVQLFILDFDIWNFKSFYSEITVDS